MELTPSIVKLSALSVDPSRSYVVHATCDELMTKLPDESVDVLYADPPFGTGRAQTGPRDPSVAYSDNVELELWLEQMRRLTSECLRVLKPAGSLYLHLDWRRIHEAKVLVLDSVLGRDCYLGEIIWSYNWGARQTNVFPRKHDTILHYARMPHGSHRFDSERMERVPYKAPELQKLRAKRLGRDDAAERVARGQIVTDVFSDINVLGTASKERESYSYPTMKPAKLIRRLLAPVVVEGSFVVDPFCGSGPTAEAAAALGCNFAIGDQNERAIELSLRRAKSVARGEIVAVER